MSTSLQSLPVSSGASGASSGLGANNSFNHADSAGSGKFGPALGEAFAALSRSPQDTFETAVADNPLADLLQTLPQGGKLLPLLEKALDDVAALGMDAQQLVDQVAQKLEALMPESGAELTGQVAAALQQFIQELPGMAALSSPFAAGGVRSGMLSETANPMIQNAEQQMAGGKAMPGQAVELERAAQRIEQLIAQRGEQNDGKTLKLGDLEQAITRLQESPQAGAMRHTELASMLASFRRLATEPRTESLSRGDILAAPSAAPATSAATTGSSLPSVSLNAPFGQPNWDQAVGERIQWMVSQKMQGAEVKLNPAHLGPMEVRIQVQNDQASVHFTAHHGVVRDALEAALPRLREMFEASGVELVDVDVSGQSFAEQKATQESVDSGPGGTGVSAETDGEMRMETVLDGRIGQGLLDLFA